MKKLTKKLLSLATALTLSLSAMAFTMTASATFEENYEYNGKTYDEVYINESTEEVLNFTKSNVAFIGNNTAGNVAADSEDISLSIDVYGSLTLQMIVHSSGYKFLTFNVMPGATLKVTGAVYVDTVINNYGGTVNLPGGTTVEVNEISKAITPTTPNGNSDIQVTATAIPAPTYTVTIPDKIEFGDCKKTLSDAENKIKTTSFNIGYNASNLAENEKQIDVSISSNFKITSGTNSLDYTILDESEKNVTNGQKLFSIIGELGSNIMGLKYYTAQLDQSKIKVGGTYTGTAYFTISLEDEEV